MKKLIAVLFVILVVLVGTYYYVSKVKGGDGGGVSCTGEAKLCPDGSYVSRGGPTCEFAACPKQVVEADYKNATYTIEGTAVKLMNGNAESPAAPGSSTKTITQYFGNDATGDLNGDGVSDVAFILTQSSGGSGTFYYVVAALKNGNGYTGTDAVLLGDRIAPQTMQIENGELIVNYADRKAGEPMTARPSLGVSKYLRVAGTALVQSPRVVGIGERCGGNMTTAPICESGLHCVPVQGSRLPFGDVGGVCAVN